MAGWSDHLNKKSKGKLLRSTYVWMNGGTGACRIDRSCCMGLVAGGRGEDGRIGVRVGGEGVLERGRCCFHGVRNGSRALDVRLFVGSKERMRVSVWECLLHILDVGFRILFLVPDFSDRNVAQFLEWVTIICLRIKLSLNNTRFGLFLKSCIYLF